MIVFNTALTHQCGYIKLYLKLPILQSVNLNCDHGNSGLPINMICFNKSIIFLKIDHHFAHRLEDQQRSGSNYYISMKIVSH